MSLDRLTACRKGSVCWISMDSTRYLKVDPKTENAVFYFLVRKPLPIFRCLTFLSYIKFFSSSSKLML